MDRTGNEPASQPSKGRQRTSAQKIAWAHKQATLIHEEIAAYIDREPYVSFIEDDPRAKQYRVVTRLHEAPPVNIALLLSDFLNNAQGTLDYLAWQLVLRDGQPLMDVVRGIYNHINAVVLPKFGGFFS